MDASGLALDGQASPDDLESLPDIFSMDDLLLDFSDQEDTAALTTAQMASSCCPYQKKFDLPLPLPWDANQNLARFHIPCDDLAEVEWLSSFVDAAFSSGGDEEDVLLFNPDMVKPSCKEEETRLYGMGKQEEEQGEVLESRRSPISVLESSSSSCSYSSTSTTTVEQQEKEIKNTNKTVKTMMMMAQMKPSPGRVRSKRSRIRGPIPTAWTSSRNVLNLDCSSFLIHTHNPTTHNTSSSSLLEMNCQNTTTKEIARANLHERDGQINLKCLHCGSQKTPQWRAGPLGPKTLCNACGVRFKSGRLYPEYRPVASPSFVASVHSNSHKKVMEIRTLKQRSYLGSLPPPLTPTTTSQPFLPKDYHLDDQWTLIRHS